MVERVCLMKVRFWAGMCLAGWILAVTASAAVVTNDVLLDFEDLGPSTLGVHMPANYGGFNWNVSDWHYLTLASVPSNTFLALSGNSTVFVSPGGKDVEYVGARFWSRRGADANGRFYYILHRDGVMVYDGRDDADGKNIFTASHDIFPPNFTGLVDTVAVVFDQGGDDWDHLAMDDVQYRSLTVVPDSPVFSEIDPNLPSGTRNAAAWGDYNNDGLVDVFIAASGSQGTTITKVYRNQGGTFVDSGLGTFAPIDEGTAAWGDCDNDGDLDLAVIGKTPSGGTSTRVYRNNLTNFVAISGDFVNVYAGDLGWADYDGDGDLDLLVCGVTASAGSPPFFTTLYRNDRTNFISIAHPFPNAYLASLDWGDYDSDGDEDLFIAGAGNGEIFRNNGGGTFTNIQAGLPGFSINGSDWGDYDNDGDLDLLIAGEGETGWDSTIYRNDGGSFSNIAAGMTGLIWAAAAWGDCDNDGDLDAAVAGYEPNAGITMTKIYRNNDGAFVDTGATTHGMMLGYMDWVDVDNDQRLELAVAGDEANNSGSSFLLYRNTKSFTNTPPTAPTNLTVSLDGARALLSWSNASDQQTPAGGLAYRVRVGATPGGSEIVSAMAIPTNGARKTVALAHGSHAAEFALKGLYVGSNYYWSVQAIDAARRGGPFSEEVQFMAENILSYGIEAQAADAAPTIVFVGSADGLYRVEVSMDLSTWTEVTNVVADSAGRIPMSIQPDADRAMYRVVRP